MESNNLTSNLNKEQIKPVLDTEGAVLVIAGAGSGKTRVLTTRIAHLILQKNVAPNDIVAITFTNKAANEMKERLVKLVGERAGLIWASTIHSLCVRILRRDIDKLGYDKNFTIYDETDKDKVLKRVIADLNLDVEKLLKPAKNIISTAKNDCVLPSQFKSEYCHLKLVEEMGDIYLSYENELARSNALDFDDLLIKTHQLFQENPQVADYYSQKFKYIHIDEFQDTNAVQFAIVKRLAESNKNIFVVGDDDQSIYGWRGAKIENILEFDKTYKDAKIYKLEQNYRSTKKILQLANHVISNNSQRREKELWTENDDGAKIETYVATDENEEAGFVAIQIKSLMARNNLSYKDFAVFMRVNALSRAYEQEFTKYAIPYRIFGGFRFFERKEIKDVLAYLRVIVNNYDDESFIRSAGVPKRGIGEKTLQELKEFAVARGLSMYQSISQLHLSDLPNSAKVKLTNFRLLLESFSQFASQNSPSKIIDHILTTTDFNSQFSEKTEENLSKLYNVNELKNTAEQFEKDNPTLQLQDYLSSMTLSSDTDSIDSDDVVTIATIHSAKGLEYKCVFVVGLDEGILPVSRSREEEDLEEERRLMYVAVTRAKERLYLTRASSRYMYGKRDFMAPSRFLKEARQVLNPNAQDDRKFSYEEQFNRQERSKFSYGGYNSYERATKKYTNSKYDGYGNDEDCFSGYQRDNYSQGENKSSTGYSSDYAKTFLSSGTPKQNGVNASVFKSGTKVRHKKFGLGTVIIVKGSGDNVIVDVAFKGIGIKSLSAKYAPMEIL